MIRHHNRSMKLKTSTVIVQAVPQHGVSGFRRKRVSIAFAKCYEQRSSRFLIVRQLPPVFVLPIERVVEHRVTRGGLLVWDGHSCPSLLTSVFRSWNSSNKATLKSKPADKSVRPTRSIALETLISVSDERTVRSGAALAPPTLSFSRFGKILVNMAKLHDRA